MIHRHILDDYQTRIKLIKPEQKEFEQSMLKEVQQNKVKTLAERKTLSENAFDKARELEQKWLKKLEAVNRKHQNRLLYMKFWKNINKAAKLILS